MFEAPATMIDESTEEVAPASDEVVPAVTMSTDEFTIAPPNPGALDEPNAVFARAERFKRAIDTAYIGLGRELYLIFHRRMFLDVGFETFDDYLERGLGMSRDRGARVRRIWTKFIKELNLKVEQLKGIGYTRALMLLGVINTDNADEWLGKARELNWRDFALKVTAAKNPGDATVAALIESGAPVTRKRAVEDDDDLSGEGGFDEIPTGGGGGALPSERSGLTTSGPSPDRRRPPRDDPSGVVPSSTVPSSEVEVLRPKRTAVTLKLTDGQLETWNAAMDEARRARANEVSPGECVANIATEFMANRTSKGESAVSRVNFFLRKFELVYGGKFIWIKDGPAAQVLLDAVSEHPDLFEEAFVPTISTIKEDKIDHDHPDESPDEPDDPE